jgi:hypothetical protein
VRRKRWLPCTRRSQIRASNFHDGVIDARASQVWALLVHSNALDGSNDTHRGTICRVFDDGHNARVSSELQRRRQECSAGHPVRPESTGVVIEIDIEVGAGYWLISTPPPPGPGFGILLAGASISMSILAEKALSDGRAPVRRVEKVWHSRGDGIQVSPECRNWQSHTAGTGQRLDQAAEGVDIGCAHPPAPARESIVSA